MPSAQNPLRHLAPPGRLVQGGLFVPMTKVERTPLLWADSARAPETGPL